MRLVNMQINKVTRLVGGRRSHEAGAITIVETLIAISLGIAVFVVWMQMQEQIAIADNARKAGRSIAAYSKAASVMLAENPPTTNRVLSIADLQNCEKADAHQFLPCSYGTATRIPFATNADGAELTFEDLEIDVQVTPQGVTGTIDFGVFRDGEDKNGDDLPDARPDLAALALAEANEESGAGVLGYYVVEFARNDPTGLVYDSDDDKFDQAAIDKLAGLKARVGASVTDAPFLRLDGSNQMTGGITFENNMSIQPLLDGLVVSGEGDLAINSGNIITAGSIQTAFLDASTIAVSDSLSVDSELGAQGVGFNHLDQRTDIARIDGNVARIDSDVRELTGEVEASSARIQFNEESILIASQYINANQNRIDLNEVEIEANQESLESQSRQILDIEERIAEVPQVCTPREGDVISEKEREGYTYNNHEDYACRTNYDDCQIQTRTPASGVVGTYKVRNTQTLACENRTMLFYTYCRLKYNQDCIK